MVETKPLTCAGCGKPLPEHQVPFIGSSEYNLWAREGYCSFFCFRDKGPPELVAEDEEIEARRQERMFALKALPERVEELEHAEERQAASVGARIAARILDTALGALVVYAAARAVAAFAFAWAAFGNLALLRPWSAWEAPVAWIAGSVLFFTACHGIAGTTPFKLIFGALVMAKRKGRRPGLARALVREVLFIADVAPLGLVAFACMGLGEENQRLGDLAAGTVVVRMEPGGARRPVARLAAGAALGLALWFGLGLALGAAAP